MENLEVILQDSLHLLDDVVAHGGRKKYGQFHILEESIHKNIQKKLAELDNAVKESISLVKVDKTIQKEINEELIKNLDAIRWRIRNKRIPKK